MTNSINEKAKKIKLLILDVDGVLTDGTIFIDSLGKEAKSFNVKDGLGMKMLLHSGVEIAIITGRESDSTTHRMNSLGIKYVYQNQKKKHLIFEELKNKLNLHDEEIAYVGDDLLDYLVMSKVGLSIAVKDAHEMILAKADFVSRFDGGKGAVREVCDLIMCSQGSLTKQHEKYLNP